MAAETSSCLTANVVLGWQVVLQPGSQTSPPFRTTDALTYTSHLNFNHNFGALFFFIQDIKYYSLSVFNFNMEFYSKPIVKLGSPPPPGKKLV